MARRGSPPARAHGRPGPPPSEHVHALARRAVEEDVGDGDLTAALIDERAIAHARVVVREPAVLCGRDWFDAVYALIDTEVRVEWSATDGDAVTAGQTVCAVRGPARAVNSGERAALNLLQTLSGTATETRRYAEALGDGPTVLLDTRKTLPGLRVAQKYAVRCGGGTNHRMGLHDAMLIKENHIAAAGGLGAAVQAARAASPGVLLEVEVETLDQLDEALSLEVAMIMLDNFAIDDVREAVARSRGRARIEVSGGLSLDSLGELAATGVDYVSVGALTKHLRAIDFSMRADDAAGPAR